MPFILMSWIWLGIAIYDTVILHDPFGFFFYIPWLILIVLGIVTRD